MKWIRKVAKNIKLKYKNLTMLAWDDMFRHWSIVELMALRVKQEHMFQPCIWSYVASKHDFEMYIPE